MVDTQPELATVTFEAAGCVMGHWGAVSIVIWGTQATVSHALEFKRLSEMMARNHDCSSTVQVLAPGSTVPTPDARAVINDLIVQYAHRLIGCAAVLEGSGFWASTMRSFLTGLQLFQRSGFKTKFCSNLEEATQWLDALHAQESGAALQQPELLRAVQQLRGRLSLGERARAGRRSNV